jgi:hypothetical protein
MAFELRSVQILVLLKLRPNAIIEGFGLTHHSGSCGIERHGAGLMMAMVMKWADGGSSGQTSTDFKA